MTPTRRTIRAGQLRQGLTLFELLLVLAIIVAVGAMVAPALQRSMTTYQLKKSADLVRSEWAKARNRAIRNGQIYVFRYVPMTGQYRTDMAASEFSLQGSTGAAGGGIQYQDTVGGVAEDGYRHLPEEILFASGTTAMDSRAVSVEQQQSGLSVSNTAEQRVFFYPDGTTSTARLTLTNQKQYITVDLRGLTGIAQVNEVTTSDEVLR